MKCAEAEALFVDAGDERLELSQEVRLAGHLDGCAGCRERAATWRRLVPGMRGFAPQAPDAMRIRRMQIEIERRLAPAARARALVRASGGRAGRPALVFASAAALAVLWVRRPAQKQHSPVARGYGVVAQVDGELTVEGRRIATETHLTADSHLALAAGHADLKLGRSAHVRLSGPARLGLEGTPTAIALRLDSGQVDAEVAHRDPGETFAVVTSELRVEVRGTHFVVGAAPGKSWVRVDEGRVEVTLASGEHRFVSTGETLASPPPEEEAPPRRRRRREASAPSEAPSPEPEEASPASPLESPAACSEMRKRLCQSDRALPCATACLRAGNQARALRRWCSVAGAKLRAAHRPARPAVAPGSARVEAELGYLRAEALRGAGHPDRRGNRRLPPARWPGAAVGHAPERALRRGRARSAERAIRARPRRLPASAGGRRRAARRSAGESMLGAMDSAEPRWGTTPPRHLWRGAISAAFPADWAPRARGESPTARALDPPKGNLT